MGLDLYWSERPLALCLPAYSMMKAVVGSKKPQPYPKRGARIGIAISI